ncbi:GNAT family N-acetyltransferase [Halobacillus salinus]|uniref:GNAT family N-acetyltransferase n=1 Tax=Halobacillus salinus TaxID=192814 RepID=UPI0009A5DA3D|nr:GNAT family N-acetyltransferase [Halobacillus salinus]
MESNAKNQTVSLIEYKDTYEHLLSGYHLPEEQQTFTSLPLQKIHNPEVSETSTHVLIMEGDRPVGYFALEDGEKARRYSDNPKARVLTSFSIDSNFQGRGMAKEGLKLLPSFVEAYIPDTDEIVLAVNKRNMAAIGLYLKTGFVDEDEVYEGRKGPQHVLHLYM